MELYAFGDVPEGPHVELGTLCPLPELNLGLIGFLCSPTMRPLGETLKADQ